MNASGRYGLTDRALHRVAFRVKLVQDTFMDVEQLLFGKRIRSIPLEHPVFIAGLPRSGTTVLLNLLTESGRFASHTYRDMPFLFSPLLWNRFARFFAVDDVPRERTHGDGIQISTRSPEAFEDVVWKRFWPSHYQKDRIIPWAVSDHKEEFDNFLGQHLRKVIAVRQEQSTRPLRYVSKNNLNIARLDALPAPMRAGSLLVPFRDPLQHAASMLLQHRRFSEIHRKEPFTREYMESIGHHEFGLGLRPIDFSRWMEEQADAERLEFWLRYWVATYRHILERVGSSIHLVSYAHLTADPIGATGAIAALIGVPEETLTALAQRLHPPRNHEVDPTTVSGRVFQEAMDLYQALSQKGAVGDRK